MRASDEKLAASLLDAGLITMSKVAERGYYNDFFSPLAAPSLQLMRDLDVVLGMVPSYEQKAKIQRIIERHKDGEFDATKEEAEEWAASAEGRETLSSLVVGKDEK